MIADLQVVEPDIDLELNTTGKLVFTIPADHPNKSHISPLVSVFTAYDGTEEIFCGRMINKTEDFYNTGRVECEGELSYLLDSIVRPYDFTSGTITDFVDFVLSSHNSQVETAKQIQRGTITVTDSNNNIARSNTEYSNSLATLQEKLVKTHGGYLRIRKTSGVKYLDYLYDFGGTNSQTVRFGENLLDISRFIDASSVITVLIPTGATIDNGDGTSSVVDIKSVNNNLDYIVNQDGVNTYGYVWGHKEWEDVTIPSNLLTKATAYLTEQISLPTTITLTAADLHLINSSVSAYKLGKWTKVESVPHSLDHLFMTTKIHISMQHQEENTLSLGKQVQTFTGNAVRNIGEISNKVNQTAKHLSSEINEKVENATQLITGGLGGYIVIRQSETDGHPEEILIMNAPSVDDATNVIRLNQNGIGFSTTGIDGPYTNAWTIDGNLVADFITGGTMLANRIRGGTLTLGGDNNVNGLMRVLNAAGSQVCKIDQTGIDVIAGTIGGIKINSSGLGSSNLGETLNGMWIAPNGDLSFAHQIGGTWSQLNYRRGTNVLGLWTAGANVGGGGMDISGGAPGDYNAGWCRWGWSDGQRSDGYYVQWYSGSDKRLKKNIKTLENGFLRELFSRINPIEFNYKKASCADTSEKHFGVIAQEIQELLEDLGYGNNHIVEEKAVLRKSKSGKDSCENYYYVNYHELHGLEIGAIKDLYEKSDEQQTEIDDLKNTVSKQRAEIDELKQQLKKEDK
jgi:phage minor structural protein